MSCLSFHLSTLQPSQTSASWACEVPILWSNRPRQSTPNIKKRRVDWDGNGWTCHGKLRKKLLERVPFWHISSRKNKVITALHGVINNKKKMHCEYLRGVLVFQCLNGCLRLAKEGCRGFSCVFLVSNGWAKKSSCFISMIYGALWIISTDWKMVQPLTEQQQNKGPWTWLFGSFFSRAKTTMLWTHEPN